MRNGEMFAKRRLYTMAAEAEAGVGGWLGICHTKLKVWGHIHHDWSQ